MATPDPDIWWVSGETDMPMQMAIYQWVAKNVPQDLIEEIPQTHTTLLYGSTSDHEAIQKLLVERKAKDFTVNISPSNVTKQGDHNKDMLYIDFSSDKPYESEQERKTALYAVVIRNPVGDLSQEMIRRDEFNVKKWHVSYSNHFTVVKLKKDAHKDPRFPALVGKPVVPYLMTSKLTYSNKTSKYFNLD